MKYSNFFIILILVLIFLYLFKYKSGFHNYKKSDGTLISTIELNPQFETRIDPVKKKDLIYNYRSIKKLFEKS